MNLQPPSTLLMGAPGSGKTTAIATLGLPALPSVPPLDVFVLFTEPNGPDALIDAVKMHGASIENFHWHTVAPVTPGWNALEEMATVVRAQSYEDISKIKQGVGKLQMMQYMELLRSIQNFPCDRTGQKYGDVTNWSEDRAFCFDGLSGLNMISMAQTVGFKPSAHQGEWGIAMNLEEQLIHKITSDRMCFFTLMAHVDKELEEISGRTLITPGALGRKLGPRLGRMFSEVVYAKRGGDAAFTWSTTDSMADLKNRALPVAAGLKPDFRPIVEAHLRRKAEIQPRLTSVVVG